MQASDEVYGTAYYLRTIADLEPGDHLCCLYETEEEHRAVLAPFLRQGLEQGEKVVYIVDAHTAETVLEYLREDGLDVEPYLARGQLSILTVGDAYMREGVFNPDGMVALLQAETERALAEGYSALRVTGEMSWALRGLPGSERLIEYESRLNGFFPGSKCLAICQYDWQHFDPAVLLDVLRAHPIAVVGTAVYDNFYYMPAAELLGGGLPAAQLRRCVQNLAEHKRAEEELESSREQLRNLARYLESAREGERSRIARELHDEMGQALTALKMDLSWLNKALPKDQITLREKTTSMSKLTDTAIKTVKRISTELRPGILDDLGLAAAIEWQAEEFQQRTGIKCEVSLYPEDISLDQVLSTAIFRVLQETLTNVARHTQATKVRIHLRGKAGKLVLEVIDDGKGITLKQISDPKSLGLVGMRERILPWHGEVKISGIPGEGTTVMVSIPLGEKGEI